LRAAGGQFAGGRMVEWDHYILVRLVWIGNDSEVIVVQHPRLRHPKKGVRDEWR
jgi:hypothetical protein